MMRKQRIGMICLMLLLALASAGPVAAAPEAAPLTGVTITVTSTGDDFSVNGNCTLREAIQAANTDKKVDRCPAGSGTDTIKLGTHIYNMTRAGRVEDSNKTGDYDIRSSVKIVGAGIGKTIIDLGKIDRAFDVRLTTVTVALQDMTIQNGYTMATDTMVPDHGGAVANRATMTITRVKFRSNEVDGDAGEEGGAVFNKARLTITASDFTGNFSLSAGGAIGNKGTLVVDNTTFTSNVSLVGGAIYNESTGTVQLNRNTKFIKNECGPGNGAAIVNEGKLTAQYNRYEANNGDCPVVESTGSTTIRYSTFINNISTRGALYGIHGTLTISHSLIKNNTASSFFQFGQVTSDGAAVVIDRSTIYGATAAGLVVQNGSARVANSTFSGLRSENCGGAVCVLGGTSVSLESVTITGTKVADGFGAIFAQAGVTKLHNTLVANTFSLAGQRRADCVSQPGKLTSQGYNLVSATDGCGWPAAAGDKLGTLAAPIDAKLAGLASNGGPTPTHALLSTSPAVNAADPALTVKTDQRMYKRPAGTRPDIGAFEYGAVAP